MAEADNREEFTRKMGNKRTDNWYGCMIIFHLTCKFRAISKYISSVCQIPFQRHLTAIFTFLFWKIFKNISQDPVFWEIVNHFYALKKKLPQFSESKIIVTHRFLFQLFNSFSKYISFLEKKRLFGNFSCFIWFYFKAYYLKSSFWKYKSFVKGLYF